MIETIFNITAPVFIVIFLGYFAVRLRMFPKEGVRFVMNYAQNFAVPLLLFGAISKVDFRASFHPAILVSYFLPMLIVFFSGFFLARLLRQSRPSATVLGFNAFFANSVLLGLLICERAFGADSLSVNFALYAFHSPFGYLVGTLSMEFAKRGEPHIGKTLLNVFKELIKNPLILGIIAGVIVNVAQIHIPQIIADAIELQARAALPVALFALGGVLTGFGFKGAILPVLGISALRLFLHAALVLFMAKTVFHLPIGALQNLVIIAAMPTGINGFVFASLYRQDEENAASIVFLTTLLSMLTISYWLYILAHI